MFSSRHPEELKGLVAGLGPLARAGTVEQAIAFGDVVVIVVPYTAMQQIGQDYGSGARKQGAGDRRQQPDRAARRRGLRQMGRTSREVRGLATAKLLPGAHVVRAFNAIGYAKLSADAHRPGEPGRHADRRRRPRTPSRSPRT